MEIIEDKEDVDKEDRKKRREVLYHHVTTDACKEPLLRVVYV